MEKFIRPQTLADILTAMPTASFWTWTRGDTLRRGHLTIYQDDIPNDRRTVHEVTFYMHCIYIDRRQLRGYNADKNQWGEYVGNSSRIELAHRRGEKALRAYIAAQAKEITGAPNPQTFSFYPGQVSRYY